MKRAIFDTNVYGLILKEKDPEEVQRKIVSKKDLIVYGYQPIRKELRDVPKTTKISRKIRVKLLSIYDWVVRGHVLQDSDTINRLAEAYYGQYRKNGGIHRWETTMKVDFLIVACGSINCLDVIYSEDNKTMRCDAAMKSYECVNKRENLRTPNFLKYSDLLNLIYAPSWTLL